MAKRTYVIDDEPAKDGPLTKLVVDPVWPLLGVMLGGVWLGWPWLLLNGRALGSPNWTGQARLLAVGLGVTIALAVAIVMLIEADIIRTATHIRLALLAVTVWKLGISYKVHALQAGTFELFRYYGGAPRSGVMPLLLGVYVGRSLVLGLIESVVWIIVVSGGADYTGPATTEGP